jgi:hypothetical protein
MTEWQPIQTAPADGQRPLYLARLDNQGRIIELDYNCIWLHYDQVEVDGHILPEGYNWNSACGIEFPTHWAYQDKSPPIQPQVMQRFTDLSLIREEFEASLKANWYPTMRNGELYRSEIVSIAFKLACSTVNRLHNRVLKAFNLDTELLEKQILLTTKYLSDAEIDDLWFTYKEEHKDVRSRLAFGRLVHYFESVYKKLDNVQGIDLRASVNKDAIASVNRAQRDAIDWQHRALTAETDVSKMVIWKKQLKEWKYIANEWAALAIDSVQCIRNMVDGTKMTTIEIQQIESDLVHCRTINDALDKNSQD